MNDTPLPDFRPAPWLRDPHLQSVLSSAQPRRWLVTRRAAAYRARARSVLLDCGAGVRLLGHYNPATGPANGRLVVLMHGWEGHSDSVYNLSLGPRLADLGFATLRLNLRDHGDSHHLNEELFHSCRLDEVVGAFRWIAGEFPAARIAVVGFSLGGNFALRVARAAPAAGIELDRVVAICPVLDPAQTLAALDAGPNIYQQYFIRKWRRSLMRKRAAFPHRYRFDDLGRFTNLADMTEYFVTRFTEFADLDSYLRGYALTDGRLDSLTVPSTLVLAADDPVIPVAGLEALSVPPVARIVRTEAGGHCGFLRSVFRPSWADDFVVEQLAGNQSR